MVRRAVSTNYFACESVGFTSERDVIAVWTTISGWDPRTLRSLKARVLRIRISVSHFTTPLRTPYTTRPFPLKICFNSRSGMSVKIILVIITAFFEAIFYFSAYRTPDILNDNLQSLEVRHKWVLLCWVLRKFSDFLNFFWIVVWHTLNFLWARVKTRLRIWLW